MESRGPERDAREKGLAPERLHGGVNRRGEGLRGGGRGRWERLWRERESWAGKREGWGKGRGGGGVRMMGTEEGNTELVEQSLDRERVVGEGTEMKEKGTGVGKGRMWGGAEGKGE